MYDLQPIHANRLFSASQIIYIVVPGDGLFVYDQQPVHATRLFSASQYIYIVVPGDGLFVYDLQAIHVLCQPVHLHSCTR